jgi:hypothetical protein
MSTTAHRPHLGRTRTALAAPRRQRAGAAAALLALLALGLTACSSGSDSGGSSAASADRAGGGEYSSGTDAGGTLDSLPVGSGDAPAAAKQVRRAAPLVRQEIRTGELTLQGDDVQGLRDEVDRLVQRYGGYVSSEKSFTDEEGRLVEDRLVLRIPATRYDRVLSGFGEVGTVLEPTSKTVDVTTEVIDVDSRIRTAEVSLERLRSFLSRSNDVNALIRLESEMAEREADLASLRAQQDYLEDQTSLATLSVTLQRPPEEEPGDLGDDGGFLAGLSGGWTALKGVLVVAVTLIGALVPFALAGALVGVPLLLVVRATRRRRSPAPPPAAPST